MPTTIDDLSTQRAKLVHDARASLKRAEDENRDPTAEERSSFDAAMAEVDALGEKIKHVQGDEERNRRLAAAETALANSQGRRSQPAPVAGTTPASPPGQYVHPKIAERLALRQWRDDRRKATWSKRDYARSTPQYRKAYDYWCRNGFDGMPREHRAAIAEVRSLQADSDTQAGYLIPPIQWQNQLIKFVDDAVFIRALATKMTLTSAKSLGAPSLDTDAADWDWTSELLIGSEETSLAVGKRDLSPHPLAKYTKISNTLLRMAPSAETLVRERLGYKAAVTQEKAYLTGTGSQQPLGLLTASSSGISTSRDVTTNSTSAFTADELFDWKYTLKAQYMNRPGLRMIVGRTFVKKARQLKDGNGAYVWQAGLGGTPDTILDVPYAMSEFMPAFSTTNYIGIMGDFSYYWIVDALSMSMQRLDELFAATNQTGFVLRHEGDAMPVLEEAFVRLKLA